MKKLVIALILMAALPVYGQEGLTASEIAARSYESTRISGSESTATLTIGDARGRTRTRRIAQLSRLSGEVQKKVIRFLAPADVEGTALLTFDYVDENDDMWLYLPALRKSRRIVSSQRAKSFMGSEFSYADITPPALEDFSYTLLGTETVGGVETWKVEMVPLSQDIAEENGFARRVSYIGKEDFVTRRTLYYDRRGELEKVLDVTEILALDPINGKYRAQRMTMENRKNGRSSTFVVDQMVLNPDLDDRYFTTRYLER